jgi:hypothetical protein
MKSMEEKQDAARKIVKKKLGFLQHSIIYGFVIIVLAVVNNTTWAGYQWWLWVALGWGIGVVSHFLNAYLFAGGSLERKMIKEELNRLDEE